MKFEFNKFKLLSDKKRHRYSLFYFVFIFILSLLMQNCSVQKFNDLNHRDHGEASESSTVTLMESPFKKEKVLINVAAENNMKPKLNLRNEIYAPGKGEVGILATKNTRISENLDLSALVNVSCLMASPKLRNSVYYINDQVSFSLTNRLLKHYQIFNLKLNGIFSVQDLENIVQKDSCIIGVSNNVIYEINDPNEGAQDPLYKDQSHHNYIKSQSAYEILFSDVAKDSKSKVVVAVIDTGVDIDHPDLKDIIWTSPLGEKLINFGGGVNKDVVGHGTHVAGLIGAISNNGVGVHGVAQGISIMAIKASRNSEGFFSTTDITNSIFYATQNKADIINLSLGGLHALTFSNYLYHEAIRIALLNNTTFFIAAGNDFNQEVSNPGTFGLLPGVITIGSIDVFDGERSRFSNNGPELDLWAPGAHKYVLLPNGKADREKTICLLSTGSTKRPITAEMVKFGITHPEYVRMCGTSMATPVAAGIGAMIVKYFKSNNINYTPETIEDIMKKFSNKKANGDLQIDFQKIAENIKSYVQDNYNINFESLVSKFISHAILSFTLPPISKEELLSWYQLLDNRTYTLQEITEGLISKSKEYKNSLGVSELDKVKSFLLGSSSVIDPTLKEFLSNKIGGSSDNFKSYYLLSSQRINFMKNFQMEGYPIFKPDINRSTEEIARVDLGRWHVVRELKKSYNRFPTLSEIDDISNLLYSGHTVDSLIERIRNSNEYFIVTEVNNQLDCYWASLFWNHRSDSPIPAIAELLATFGSTTVSQAYIKMLVSESTEKKLIGIYKDLKKNQPSCYDIFTTAKMIRTQEMSIDEYINKVKGNDVRNIKFDLYTSGDYIANAFVRNFTPPRPIADSATNEYEWFEYGVYPLTKNEIEFWYKKIEGLTNLTDVYKVLNESNNGKIAQLYTNFLGWNKDDYKNNYHYPRVYINQLNEGRSYDQILEEISISDDKFIRDEYKKYGAYPSFGVWEYYLNKLKSKDLNRVEVAKLISNNLLFGKDISNNPSQPIPQPVISTVPTTPVATAEVSASLKLSCTPTSTTAGATVTCRAEVKNIASGKWYVNNTEIGRCANNPICVFEKAPAGKYEVKAQGLSTSGKAVYSNIVSVLIK